MKRNCLFLLATILPILLFGGCGEKETADQYVGEQITRIKEEDPSILTPILEEGIASSNDTYVLQFPEELKETYLSFLQKAFQNISFEVSSAEKNGEDNYSVQLAFSPLDIESTTLEICGAHLSSMSTTDLAAETASLLEQAQQTAADSPVYTEELHHTISVQKDENGYLISDEEMQTFLSLVLENYMAPYNAVCEILDIQDFLTACLDANLKGEVTQYAKHASISEAEALSYYESGTFDLPAELDSAYAERYKAALQSILRQCQYTVGIPKKVDDLFNYTVEVMVTPNTSLISIMSELENGTYYSSEEVSRTLVEALERYAASPSYGEPTGVTISVNFQTLIEAGQEGGDLTNLVNTIFPIP